MPRRKILLQTNAPWLHTGLGLQGRALMKHLLKRQDKYDLHYYCTQVLANDPQIARMPCKAYGAIPNDPQFLHALNQDQGRARDVAYGGFLIDEIVKREKPDIYLGSDDQWGFNGYVDKPWWGQINSLLHITLDSRPILETGFDSAKKTKGYFTWARFAALNMNQQGAPHVRNIYGASQPNDIEPISATEKADLRRRFGIDQDTTVFLMVNRNQLRKGHAICIKAFADFQWQYPKAKAKLYYHCSWSEKAQGWDIEKLARHYGVKMEDILCTYVCKACGGWHVSTYKGEDVDCPCCGAQKSNVTATIGIGVQADEMKYVYGIADAGLSIFNSGGQEMMTTNALFAGLYTAVTNYSCGEDFAELPFVHSVGWSPYYEPGSNFIKAASDPVSITAFMARVYHMSQTDKDRIREEARNYAIKTFSIDAIGTQWEAVFDALPPKDWSSITLTAKLQNPDYPMPQMASDEAFMRALYNGVLCCEPDPKGLADWLQSLANKVPRDLIYEDFRRRAREHNGANTAPQDFSALFDEGPRKRVLYVIKESGGDVFISTALFPGLKRLYPEADLYVATEPRFHDLLKGLPESHRPHKVLAYHPAMENELLMAQYVTHYVYPAVATQVRLAYLTRECGLDLTPPPALVPAPWGQYIDQSQPIHPPPDAAVLAAKYGDTPPTLHP